MPVQASPSDAVSDFTPRTPPRVPVTIVTGFLGAGKTSLLNHILTGGHGRRIAVLVNDFGRINIDAALIANRDDEVVSLENGCICCSLSDGLLAAVARLIRREQPPEHILIETSGVSDPVEVASTFSDPELQPYAPLEGIVTVVDAELAPALDDASLSLARCQVAAADIAILNKIDLVDDDGRQRAREWVRESSPHVRVLEVSQGRVPIELLFDLGGAVQFRNAEGHSGHHDHQDKPPFDTYTFESDEPLPVQRLHDVLSRLPRTIFRAKGLLNLVEKPDHPVVLQSTGRRATLTVGRPWGERLPRTQIVFIGSRGGVDGAWLMESLNGRRDFTVLRQEQERQVRDSTRRGALQ